MKRSGDGRGRELRTVIVDDSALARLLLRDALAHIPGIRVVGNASEGQAAIDVVDAVEPDLVTLDVEMPGISGIDLLKELKSRHPDLQVLMCSRETDTGTQAATEALTRGAFDFVHKPSSRNRDANVRQLYEQVAQRLRPLLEERFGADHPAAIPAHDVSHPIYASGNITANASAKGSPANGTTIVTVAESRSNLATASAEPIDVVLIGSSTGGPAALRQLLNRLRADLAVPVCVVQHIPPGFSKPLAARLNQHCSLAVVEVTGATSMQPGTVYLAPGGKHLLITGTSHEPILTLGDGELEHGCRPAIDVTLRSAQRVFGARSLAVILTGMGRDGAAGAAIIRESGGRVIVQSPETSTVSSMPRQTLESAGADAVGDLDELADWINDAVR